MGVLVFFKWLVISPNMFKRMCCISGPGCCDESQIWRQSNKKKKSLASPTTEIGGKCGPHTKDFCCQGESLI